LQKCAACQDLPSYPDEKYLKKIDEKKGNNSKMGNQIYFKIAG
jgi:hypothetical protein